MAAESPLLAKVVLSRYFGPTSWISLKKQLFLSPIDSEPIRARGIIDKDIVVNFYFSFVLTSLAYISIPENKGETKIFCHNKLTTTYIFNA